MYLWSVYVLTRKSKKHTAREPRSRLADLFRVVSRTLQRVYLMVLHDDKIRVHFYITESF